MVKVKVRRLHAAAVLPKKHHPSDAGFDIVTIESHTLKPGERKSFATGIAVEFPEGYMAIFHDRSGLGAKGVHTLAGVIDSGYRGEWKVVLINHGSDEHPVRSGDRIVQCLFKRVEQVEIEEVDALQGTERGTGGFGSTGQ